MGFGNKGGTGMKAEIRGVLFDKDGTLFDFASTWSVWAQAVLVDLAQGDLARAARLGARIGFDLGEGRFASDSVAIAGTPDEIARHLAPGVPEMDLLTLTARIDAVAARTPQVESVPLAPLLARLRGLGLALGVATNDAEATARAHLAAAGVAGAFDYIAGYDSGHGGKPGPGMCLGFARATEADPAHLLMVGDSAHDLKAGRAAGMRCIAVLTGMAGAGSLGPLADAVLPDIGHLPDWIAAASRG